jgi:hypothetical protein
MLGHSFFLIFNRTTGDFKKVYGARTMPALYLSRAIAQGELSKQQRYGNFKGGYEVVEVTIEERWKK